MGPELAHVTGRVEAGAPEPVDRWTRHSRIAMMTRRFFCLLLGALVLVGSASSLRACDDDFRLLGAGIHAFHQGRLVEAHDLLSQSIARDGRDARVYYFRGLVAHRQGDAAAGDQDFQTAAQLEAAAGRAHFNVARSLERVQGPLRARLETVRRAALKEAQQRRAAAAQGLAGTPPASGEEGSQTPFDPSQLPEISQLVASTLPFADPRAPLEAWTPPPADPARQPSPIVFDSTPSAAGATPAATGSADPFGQNANPPAPAAGSNSGGNSDPFGGTN